MRIYDDNFQILAISGDDIRNMGGGEKILLKLCTLIHINILSIYRPVEKSVSPEPPFSCAVKYILTLKISALGFNVPIGLFSPKTFKSARSYTFIISFHSNIFSILFTIILNKLDGKPMVHFLHDPTVFDISESKIGIYKKIQLALIRYIPDIHVELPEQARFLKNIGFRGRIHQFPLYFSMDLDENNLQIEERFTILFIGRIEIKQKGIDLLAAIIKDVLSKTNDVHFHIIGSDYGGVQIIRQIENEFPDNVKYFGRVTEDRLQEEYREASLFVSTSRYETLGLSILEAMNYGIEIICFDVPGLGSLIDENTGIKINPFDTTLFSKAILESYESWRKEPDKFHMNKILRIKEFKNNFDTDSIGTKIKNMLELAQKS